MNDSDWAWIEESEYEACDCCCCTGSCPDPFNVHEEEDE